MNYNAIIERIIDTAQEKLSNWELDFICGCYSWVFEKKLELTDPMKKKLLQINRKILGG